MNNDTLATEMIKKLKAKIKRQRIAFFAALCLWLATIGVFVWYISACRI